MVRIKLEDLARELKISNDEMRKVLGGAFPMPGPGFWSDLEGFHLADPRPSPLKFRGIKVP